MKRFLVAQSEGASFPVMFFLIAAMGAMAFVLILGPASNYSIYEYFSTYHLQHGTYPHHTPGVTHPVEPKYRDYSPLNALI
jgi:hypothetical protein